MARSISIIGSFRKPEIYNEVCKWVRIFQDKGIIVNSPRGSEVHDSIDAFVRFKTDDLSMTPADIQMVTLDKILKSDVVLVCDPNGYVGRTTCYEIGFCLSRRIPLYFTEKPNDLPIDIPKNHIVSYEELLNIVFQNREEFSCNSSCSEARFSIENIWPTPNQTIEEKNKRIVICGSMMFWEEMKKCQSKLKEMGIEAIIPKDENGLLENMSDEEFRKFKRKVSSAYLKKIREKETIAVLVFNEPKKGIDNYIGANTFVELAMAFAWNRTIFLLNDIYTPYEDELLAWDAICLHGDTSRIKSFIDFSKVKEKEEFIQLSIFDGGDLE